MRRSNWTVRLLCVNALTLLLLVATCYQSRVLPKAYQRLVVEKRVPYLVQGYRLNRAFDSTRAIHQLYDASRVSTLIVGDSLVSQVSWSELMADPSFVGRGIPGDVVQGVLERIPDYQELELKRVVFLVGTNDSIRNQSDDVIATLQTVHAVSQVQWPGVEILQCTLPPVAAWIEDAERVNADNSAINRQLGELSVSEGFTIVDLESQMVDSSGYMNRQYTSDGIHLNAAGYEVVRKLLRDHVR